MRESSFIRQNFDKWKYIETRLELKKGENPDELASLYIQLTDDLSYAKTFYPKSKVTDYLNDLTGLAYANLYKNKREKSNRFITFWKSELPLLYFKYQKTLALAFFVLIISFVFGYLSAAFNEDFVRGILGDRYVNMTIENIESGDPMGVYGKSEPFEMFITITGNNIYVSFLTFIWGGVNFGFPVFIFLSGGSIFSLLYNGIVLGAFMRFFYDYSLTTTASSALWIHGVFELTAITIAAAAGIIMGNGILLPGTRTRIESFAIAAKDGLKILLGLIPFFIVAGFLEGFVTRHYKNELVAWFIIILSLVFVIWYFVIYPINVKKNYGSTE